MAMARPPPTTTGTRPNQQHHHLPATAAASSSARKDGSTAGSVASSSRSRQIETKCTAPMPCPSSESRASGCLARLRRSDTNSPGTTTVALTGNPAEIPASFQCSLTLSSKTHIQVPNESRPFPHTRHDELSGDERTLSGICRWIYSSVPTIAAFSFVPLMAQSTHRASRGVGGRELSI